MKKSHKWILLFLVAAAIAAGLYCYYYNLPRQRAERLLARAEKAMQGLQYEEADRIYDEILEIVPENESAREGKTAALFGQADALAVSEELADRSRACGIYRKIIDFEEKHDSEKGSDIADHISGSAEESVTEKYRSRKGREAEEKLSALEEKIAAGFKTVSFETKKQDRSETVRRLDGTEAACIWYYDLVQVTEEAYPYSEKINSVLRQQMDDFFSGTMPGSEKDPISAAAGQFGTDDFKDYVGEAGVYSGNGLLGIRMAHVRAGVNSLSNIYCGMTFRLSDAEQLMLTDLTGRNGPSLKKLVWRKLWTYLKEQGYRSISKSDVDEYVENTQPEDFKFCIRDEGEVCLVIDQEVPFFASAQEVLEIPLE